MPPFRKGADEAHCGPGTGFARVWEALGWAARLDPCGAGAQKGKETGQGQ